MEQNTPEAFYTCKTTKSTFRKFHKNQSLYSTSFILYLYGIVSNCDSATDGQVQPTARMQPMDLPKHTDFTSCRISTNMHGCKKAIMQAHNRRGNFQESIFTIIHRYVKFKQFCPQNKMKKHMHAHCFKSRSPGSPNCGDTLDTLQLPT